MLRGLKTFQHIFFIAFSENYLSSGVPDSVSTIIFTPSGPPTAFLQLFSPLRESRQRFYNYFHLFGTPDSVSTIIFTLSGPPTTFLQLFSLFRDPRQRFYNYFHSFGSPDSLSIIILLLKEYKLPPFIHFSSKKR